jgi:hypothetical protein
MTKSIDHVRLGASGRSSWKMLSCQSLTMSSVFYAQTAEMIKAVHALVVNMKAFATK